MTTLIFGLGLTGRSCFEYLNQEQIIAYDSQFHCDQDLEKKIRKEYSNVQLVGMPDFIESFAIADRLIVSPGISLNHDVVKKARSAGLPISSDIDLFMETNPKKVIAITGTNGKSTVTSLVAEMMSGKQVGVGGNLGPPALDLLQHKFSTHVLELSSFQLERMRRWHFEAACILNITRDHLDRYESFEKYARVKHRIYGSCNWAVYNGSDQLTSPDLPHPRGIPIGSNEQFAIETDGIVIGGTYVSSENIGIVGRHNLFNATAAAALAFTQGIGVDRLRYCLAGFVGLPHRCQLVTVQSGVKFIDDSKATNVGSCLAALAGFGDESRRNIILLAGGDGKGADFELLFPAVERFVKHTVLFGQDAKKIQSALRGLSTSEASDFESAVLEAANRAKPGDYVLLSPACSSLDMFDGFEHRGKEFSMIVERFG